MSSAAIHDELDRRAEKVAARVIAWRRHLHRNPELSNREVRTAALVADQLRALGLDEVRTGIAGHGVVGVLRGGAPGGRVAALRADMDALPVRDLCGAEFASPVVDADYPGGPFPVSHACGHDCHTAMLLGAATVLAGVRERLQGTVLFVFQPAEEGRRPREDRDHRRAGPRLHTVAGRRPDAGGGRGADRHRAAVPAGVGVRPRHGLHRACRGRRALQHHRSDRHPVGHRALCGGSDMAEVRRRLARLAEHSAAAYGATATVEYLQPVPPVYNSAEWVAAALPTVRRVVGEGRTVPTGATLGYDDVSELVNRFGGLYVMLGVQDGSLDANGHPVPTPGGRGLVTNHHPRFYAADDTLVTSARLHAQVAYDHLAGTLTVG